MVTTRAIGHGRQRSHPERDALAALVLLPDHYLRLDLSGRVLRYEAPCSTLSLPILGRSLQDFLTPAAALAFESELAQAGSTARTLDIDLHVASERRTFEARLVPAGDDAMLAILRDVTERRRNEGERASAQRIEIAGRLAGSFAHDFNNVLTAIAGHAQLALDEGTGSGAAAHLREVLVAVARAAETTRTLGVLARKQSIARGPVDLCQIAREAAELGAKLCGERLSVRTRSRAGACTARCDAESLERALVHLMVRACDAAEERAEIALSARPRAGGGAVLRIRIRGSALWDGRPLASASCRDAEPELLSGVAGVLEDGARVVVRARAARDTRVALFLPAGPRERATGPARPGSAAGRRTILLADDDSLVRAVVARALDVYGYGVIEAEDGRAAMALAERDLAAFDAVITDVVMPNMDGPRLAARLRALRPELPVLFISGFTDVALGSADLAHPRTSLLPKPFAPPELRERLEALLETAVAER